jgi:hypothetical protein
MKDKYIELLVEALELFYQNDAESLFAGRLVHEQAMVGCIARYAWCLRRSDPRFSSLLPDVDVEYDKVQESEPKAFDALIDHIESCPEYYSLCGGTICNDKQVDEACNDEKCKYCEWKNKPKRFRPDLIVHKRNEDLNGLVVEFKKGGDGKLEDVEFDMAKLRACTCAQNGFHVKNRVRYDVGAFVLLEETQAHIKVFLDRKVVSWFKVNEDGRCEYATGEEVPFADLHEPKGLR